MLHSAFKKFLHDPTVNIKSVSNSPRLESMAEAMKFLFELGDEATPRDSYKFDNTTLKGEI